MDRDTYSITDVARAFGLAVSALRYYEEIGLLSASERKGRVRYYDRDALTALAYVQLWRADAMMSIEETRAVLDSRTLEERRSLIREARDGVDAKIAGLQRARGVLDHMLDCRTDQPLDCPVTGEHLRRRVDAALGGRPLDDGFLPSAGGGGE